MRRTLLMALLLVAACATNDPYDDSQPEPRGGRMGGGGGMRMRGGMSGGEDSLLPEANWWHSPHIAEAVNLSAEQMQQLDKLQAEQGDEIERLARDLVVTTRDIRTAVNQHDAKADDITTAGDRVATLRDQLFRRRITMLAGERAILTYDQWTKLQDQLQERYADRRERGFGGRMGGGGRRGGGMGRRPPF